MIYTARQKTILYILRKYSFEEDHAHQVKNLALMLFDKTKGALHDFSRKERDLLEAGTLLHDVGYYYGAKDHHKNSEKIILEERPSGFSDDEIKIIANIARYHRGKLPKERHETFSNLPDELKILSRKLSAIARLADALDRTHISVVKNIECVYDFNLHTLILLLDLNGLDGSVEISKAEVKKNFFEEEFGVNIKFRVE